MKKDKLAYTVIFTALSAFSFVFLLSLAYGATKGKVDENNAILEAKAYLSAVGIQATEDMNIQQKFKDTFPDYDENKSIQETTIDGETIIVSPFQGNGLWGTITGVLGMTSDFKRIIGFEIISHVETPGLGGRIDESWFKEQFKGEYVGNGIVVRHGSAGGDRDTENGEVDGITGASRTSDSIQSIINNQIVSMKSAYGGTAHE